MSSPPSRPLERCAHLEVERTRTPRDIALVEALVVHERRGKTERPDTRGVVSVLTLWGKVVEVKEHFVFVIGTSSRVTRGAWRGPAHTYTQL